MTRIFILGLILFLLGSCKSIDPISPTNFVEPYPSLNSEKSSVTIPIEMDLSKYLKEADDAVPKSYSGKNEQCEGVSTSYFFKREGIDFSGSGNKIGYAVDGQLKLKINYCPKCHTLLDEKGTCLTPRVYLSCGDNEPMRKFKLKYSTLVKVNSDYTFNTTTNLQKFELLDPCELSIANIDVTQDVELEIKKQLKNLEIEIDKQFKSIDIKSTAKSTWSLLQESTEIPGYGFLSLGPTSLSMSEIEFNGKKASFDFSIDISPSFTTEKPKITSIALPDLSKSVVDNGLSFGLDAILSYDSLSNFIRTSFKGEIFEVKRKKIVIEDLWITGSKDNRIILKTKFSGTKKGTVYLLASPVLNDSLHRIELKNVDFDVESKSILLKSAQWFFNSKIVEMIEQKAVFDYDPMVSDMKKEINSAMNQELTKGVSMKGKITQIDLNQIYYTNTHLVLRTHLNGDLKLILE